MTVPSREATCWSKCDGCAACEGIAKLETDLQRTAAKLTQANTRIMELELRQPGGGHLLPGSIFSDHRNAWARFAAALAVKTIRMPLSAGDAENIAESADKLAEHWKARFG